MMQINSSSANSSSSSELKLFPPYDLGSGSSSHHDQQRSRWSSPYGYACDVIPSPPLEDALHHQQQPIDAYLSDHHNQHQQWSDGFGDSSDLHFSFSSYDSCWPAASSNYDVKAAPPMTYRCGGGAAADAKQQSYGAAASVTHHHQQHQDEEKWARAALGVDSTARKPPPLGNPHQVCGGNQVLRDLNDCWDVEGDLRGGGGGGGGYDHSSACSEDPAPVSTGLLDDMDLSDLDNACMEQMEKQYYKEALLEVQSACAVLNISPGGFRVDSEKDRKSVV